MTTSAKGGALPYEEISLPEYAEQAAQTFTVERHRPGTLILQGPCPRCAALMEFLAVDHLIEGTLAPRQHSRLKRSEADHEELLYCKCEDDHPQRPAGRKGCGAYWTLRMARQ